MLFGTDAPPGHVISSGMAKRTKTKTPARKAKSAPARRAVKPTNKNNKKKTTRTAKRVAQKRPKVSTSKKAATKSAAKLKAAELEAIAIAQAAEQTAATTLAFAPAPFEIAADPAKAPGKQHKHPPHSLHGVKHSEAYIAKARTPFNRRMNIGR